uniref:Uncharacterized protein n=1 Tax=Anguilla anguilla TaxID=7936 RepID=A0A0E9U107_ANGAN
MRFGSQGQAHSHSGQETLGHISNNDSNEEDDGF